MKRYFAASIAALFSVAAVAQQPVAKVYGIELGKPLILPRCVGEPGFPDMVAAKQPVTCSEAPAIVSNEPWKTAVVHFPLDALPALSRLGTVAVMLLAGRAEGIEVFTDGAVDQERALDQLTQKFGKPDVAQHRAVSNLAGASFDSVTAIWAPLGMVVTLAGTFGTLDRGRITIDTTFGANARKADLDERRAKRTAL